MDSRTVLWYVVLAAIACLGVAMTTLAYVNMVNFPPSDATLTKDLAVYSDIVKAAPLGCPSDNVLCDYYMSSSGYTVIPSTTVYTYITTDAITEVIKGGARLIELDIYSVGGDPVVGLADSKTNNMFTYNTLKFEDCCTTLANTMFNSGTTTGYANPFVLSLNFHSEDNAFITRCADVMKMTLRKFMLRNEYSYQRKNLAVEPICNRRHRICVA